MAADRVLRRSVHDDPASVAAAAFTPPSSARRLVLAWSPLLAISTTFAAMMALSWGRWPDVLIDFGHELYVPWQLSLGRKLGQDVILAATGPLPPLVNALWFRCFGTGIWTLFTANLVLLAATTLLLYRLLRGIGGAFAATSACVLFLSVFAFGQYMNGGNFNYVAPYSHGTTHGMLLSLVSLAFLARAARTRASRDLAGMAVSVGLVFLTKPELFVADAAAVGLGVGLLLRAAAGGRERLRVLAFATLPALVPLAVCFGILVVGQSPRAAFAAEFAPWLVLGSPLVRTPFYVSGLGLDAPEANLRIALTTGGAYAAALAGAAIVDWRVRRPTWVWALALAVGLAGVLAGVLLIPAVWWSYVARPLPLLAAVGAGASLWFAWTNGSLREGEGIARASLWAFGLLLLLKMGLNARIFQYGFVLSMPATALIATALLSSVPRWLEARGGSGLVFRAFVGAALVVMAVIHVNVSAGHFSELKYRVGQGRDAFYADGRGAFVNAALEHLSVLDPAATLAVFPEGVMINYLTRRATPSPHMAYMPDAIALYGEQKLLAPYLKAPPDLVLVVSRDMTEHGARLFGRDYAPAAIDWLSQQYEPLGTIGASPFEYDQYGMMLLARRGADLGPRSP